MVVLQGSTQYSRANSTLVQLTAVDVVVVSACQDWFQLYMLWNLLQSTGILGLILALFTCVVVAAVAADNACSHGIGQDISPGGRGGGHYGGFGRRRRGFF